MRRGSPHTIAGDGDPVDVLVITPFAVTAGAGGRRPALGVLRLEGEALERFDTTANLHVRLHLPASPATAAVVTRYYTIRHIDTAAGWVDIDFVLHEAPGPGGDFARLAKVGDICGMSGPCGLGAKPAPFYLLAGDETALPAIARIAETLPVQARGKIILEIGGREDQIDFRHPAGIAVSWLYRGETAVEEQGLFTKNLAQALAEVESRRDSFVWIAGEYSAVMPLRTPLKRSHAKRSLCVPYWRAEGRFSQTSSVS